MKDLIKNILDKNKYLYEEHTEYYDENSIKNYISHTTFYIPNKKHYEFLISFDTPFDGFRYAKGKDPDARWDKDIDEIEKLLTPKGRKKRGRKV